MGTLRRLLLSEIVEDRSVYPRQVLDEIHVADLLLALRAGAVLPPLTAEVGTLRLVDGWHRLRALKRFRGENGDVEVELARYPSDGALFMDAVLRNSLAVRKLGRSDQVHIIVRARELGVADGEIARTLHVPPERIERLILRLAESPEGEPVVLKPAAAWMQGNVLSPEQIASIRRMRGSTATSLAYQLIDLLKNGIANVEDRKVRRALYRLADLVYECVEPEDWLEEAA